MPVKYRDYYEILGVPRSASDAEIKRAFRKLAREHHPDVARNKRLSEEKFKEINEAYEVLSDPAKRRKYDQLGAHWSSGAEFRPPPGWEGFGGPGGFSSRGGRGDAFEFQFGGTGFSDFFEQIFGGHGRRSDGGFGGMGGGFGDSDVGVERGQDIEGDILVTLDEALKGSVRSVSVRHGVTCDHCRGAGSRLGRFCQACSGTGRVTRTDTYKVKVPPGVTEGQRLRVAGRGQAGTGGAAAGDLFLRVRFAKHPDFDVDGHNLVHEADLAPWEAVLGANISVPTPEGDVSIRIPPGMQNGRKLRLRGRGLPHRDGGRGDLIVVAKIQVPERVTETERQLWEKLARESSFRPRE